MSLTLKFIGTVNILKTKIRCNHFLWIKAKTETDEFKNILKIFFSFIKYCVRPELASKGSKFCYLYFKPREVTAAFLLLRLNLDLVFSLCMSAMMNRFSAVDVLKCVFIFLGFGLNLAVTDVQNGMCVLFKISWLYWDFQLAMEIDWIRKATFNT